jgi:hypothetical protein
MGVGDKVPYGPWYLFLLQIKRKKDEKLCCYIFIVSGTKKGQFDHDNDTPHRRPTNAKFDNKPLMKKRGKTKGGVLQTPMIMAMQWGGVASA